MPDKPYIAAVIREIERRLADGDGMTAKEAARFCHVSTMQLERDFYSATGFSVIAYIRTRRLSKALALLKTTSLPPADIAYACGYGSQPLLCRSVKRAINQTPLQYRNGDAYYGLGAYGGARPFPVSVSMRALPGTRSFHFYHAEASGIEERAVHALYAAQPAYAGRLFGQNAEKEGGLCCYALSVERDVWEYGAAPAGFAEGGTREGMTSQLLAQIITPPGERDVTAAWDYLCGAWLGRGMFGAAGAHFEEFTVKNGRIRRLTLYLPVYKRVNAYRITTAYAPGMAFITGRAAGPEAEERAARAAVCHANTVSPALVGDAAIFYVQKNTDECVCGVGLQDTTHAADGGTPLLVLPPGKYALLECDGCGDGAPYQNILTAWAADNGLDAEGAAFTLYTRIDGAAGEHSKMKTMILVKNG